MRKGYQMLDLRKFIASFLIFNHLVAASVPLFYSSSLRADALSELSKSMNIMRAELSGEISPDLAPPSSVSESTTSSPSVYQTQPAANLFEPLPIQTAPEGTADLPTLSASDSNMAAEPFLNQQSIQSGLQSVWGVMGSDSPSQSGMNMATDMASGLATNAVRDWLAQKGNARIEFSTKGKKQGQVLFPLWESGQSVIFSQTGILDNSDRTIYHLGVGWRSYLNEAWMLGVNSFWDYDNTGNNARLGAGAEVWTHSLKLAANGYFRMTDWHQSPIYSMRDYDERPANGFDIRAEAWLPVYPQLSGSLKYEKYYGDGVVLSSNNSPGNRANSPHAYTTGLRYTPIPLVTLGAEHKRGSTNETLLNLSLNYRFGQTWKELTDSRLIQVARSLAGQRYDFVDRNYDIVMQYRKQDLINLSLPATIMAEASSQVVLKADVGSKYGLKSVAWNTADILLAGGSIVSQSETEILLKMPPYRESTANSFTVSAQAKDMQGNTSPEARTIISLIRSSNTISLDVTPANNLISNGAEVSTAIATVTDGEGQPLPQMNVTFTLTGNDSSCTLSGSQNCQTNAVTDNQGRATVRAGHTLAGLQTLVAELDNGNSDSSTLQFIADSATARIETLIVNTSGGLADGQNGEELVVSVVDAAGNPVPDITVYVSASGEAYLSVSSVTTDGNGKSSFVANSLVAGTFQVTANTNGSNAQAPVTFQADSATASLASGALTVIADHALANNTATNEVHAVVTDAHGNRVNGVAVNFSVSNGANVSPATVLTGADGTASVLLTSSRAGVASVTATVNSSSAGVDINFVADISTARISLEIASDQAIADGMSQNSVVAIVTDEHNNPLAINVSFSAGNGAVISSQVTTGPDGRVATTLTSITAGESVVTATLDNGQVSNIIFTFLADTSTASLSLSVTSNNALANGLALNSVNALVTDVNGNPVANATLSLVATGGAVVTSPFITGQDGRVAISLASIAAGDTTLTATLDNGFSGATVVTFIADSSTAAGNLTVVSDNSLANGVGQNVVQAQITDANGNPVPEVAVSFSAEDGVILAAPAVVTDNHGLATLTLTSTSAGHYQVTAIINGSSQSVAITFIADMSTAALTLEVLGTDAVADGQAQNKVRATVFDANENPVPDIEVNFSANNSATITASAVTNQSGQAESILTNTVAGETTVTATVNGDTKNVTTSFLGDYSTASLSLVVINNESVADNQHRHMLTATVADAQGNPLPNILVLVSSQFVTSGPTGGVTTDSAGQAEFYLGSTYAGVHRLEVTLEPATTGGQPVNNSQTEYTSLTFIADVSTATVNLEIIDTDAVADGQAQNKVLATVTDAFDNPLADVSVAFTTDSGASVGTPVISDVNGKVEAGISTTLAGDTVVTATLASGSTDNATVTFIADISTARLALEVTTDGVVANNTDENWLLATLTDANGNPLNGQPVGIGVAENVGDISFEYIAGTTDSTGQISSSVRRSLAGEYAAGAKLYADTNESVTAETTMTFVADVATAGLAEGSLSVINDDAIADGLAQNTVQATVTDAKGNPVPGVTVSFSADEGVILGAPTVITDLNGQASTPLTSTSAGNPQVTATINGSSQSATVNFIAGSINGMQSTLSASAQIIPADGNTETELRFEAKDEFNNKVSGLTDVQFNITGTAVMLSPTVESSPGVYTATLKSANPGIAVVNVNIDGDIVENTNEMSINIYSLTFSGSISFQIITLAQEGL